MAIMAGDMNGVNRPIQAEGARHRLVRYVQFRAATAASGAGFVDAPPSVS